MTNQKCGVVGSFADLMTVRSVITVGTIPAIRKFIDSEFGHECIGERGPVRAAGQAAHKQRLKNRPAKAEAQNIFNDHLGQACHTNDARNHLPAKMPRPSPATQCMVDPSVWRQRAAV